MEPVILVSVSEIMLKSPYVRRLLQRTLLEHLRWKLKRSGFSNFKTTIDSGRIAISGLSDTRAAQECSHVFGVVATMNAGKIVGDPDRLAEEASAYAVTRLSKGDTFAVRAHVAKPYPTSGIEIERKAGAAILARLGEKDVTVNLDHPTRTIHIEVRPRASYLYDNHIRGYGGLPYGSQGRLVGLLSGGIDSPVALWLMMKRGSHVIPIFMDMAPYAGEDYKDKAIDVARKLREFAPVSKYGIIIAPFGEIVEEILRVKEAKYRCVLCKRMMYRVACSIAGRQRAVGIVTGESLGQVASQTLTNLSTIDEAASLPAHRPLIGLDKMEIQALAQQIGTYEISIRKADGCRSAPRKPATSATVEKIRTLEKGIPIDPLVTNASKRIKKIDL